MTKTVNRHGKKRKVTRQRCTTKFASGTVTRHPHCGARDAAPRARGLRHRDRAHAASLTLAARDDVLRVLITASAQTRQHRLAASLGVDEKQAARVLKRSDAGRADYIKRFYGIGVEQPTHYDLVLNTDKLTPVDAARLIVDAVNGSP